MRFAGLIGCVVAVVTASSAAAAATPVTVRITDAGSKLSRTTVPVGVVRFVVSNAGRRRHTFSIAGKATPPLAPGKATMLKVTFAVPGSYTYRSSTRGVLHVVVPASAPTTTTAPSTPALPSAASTAKPCASPATTTVRVTMTDVQGGGGYTFSPLPIQCGTVTFVLVNNGQDAHGLGLTIPYGYDLPDGPTVPANQTASMTLTLSLSGRYEWRDSEGEGVETTFGYLNVQ
jgi:plastocyanin